MKLRNRISTTILLCLFVGAATIRIFTGETDDLFVAGQEMRYAWPFALCFFGGYLTHAIVDFIYDRVDAESSFVNAESDEE